jgi:hypothetical protein
MRARYLITSSKALPGRGECLWSSPYGNFAQFRSKSSIDFPAWGPLSAQLTFLHDERDGYARNLGAGTGWHYGAATGGRYGDRISPDTLGGHDTNAVSAALKLELGADRLSAGPTERSSRIQLDADAAHTPAS